MANEYTALGPISQPGVDTYAVGYRRGDAVTAAVVENWALVVGEHVVEGDLDEDGPASVTMTRPGPGDNRAAWEAWAVANGMSADDAAEASQDDLEAAGPSEDGATADPGRPADSAKKAEWVAYVSGHPQATDDDRAWASADSTTKADLQGWQPGLAEVGDPVAVAATEAANG